MLAAAQFAGAVRVRPRARVPAGGVAGRRGVAGGAADYTAHCKLLGARGLSPRERDALNGGYNKAHFKASIMAVTPCRHLTALLVSVGKLTRLI